MAIFYCPIQCIETKMVSATDTNAMLDERFHSSYMTIFGSQVKRCGLQLIPRVNVSFNIHQPLNHLSMTIGSSTIQWSPQEFIPVLVIEHTHTHVYTHKHVYTHTCIHTNIRTHTHVYTHMLLYTHACTHTHTQTCTHTLTWLQHLHASSSDIQQLPQSRTYRKDGEVCCCSHPCSSPDQDNFAQGSSQYCIS